MGWHWAEDGETLFQTRCFGACRGGPKSADHVDILGNAGVLEDIGMIAAGRGAELQDRFASRVRDIAAAINVEYERAPKR